MRGVWRVQKEPVGREMQEGEGKQPIHSGKALGKERNQARQTGRTKTMPWR